MTRLSFWLKPVILWRLKDPSKPAGKPALGRGLGKLMRDAKHLPNPKGLAARLARLTPGMAALLRGSNGGSKLENDAAKPRALGEPPTPEAELQAQPESPPAAPTSRPRRKVRVSLVLADLLFLGLAARLIFKPGGPNGFIEMALCALALLVGAWLSWLALWWEK